MRATGIRLKGLDAPEFGQTCTNAAGADWPCGVQARDRLARIAKDSRLVCTGTGTDRYAHLLATCRAGDADVEEELVRAGTAISTGGHDAAAHAARTAERGIWKGSFQDPAAWRRAPAQQPSNTGASTWLDRLWGN